MIGITVLLALSVFMLIVADSVPATSLAVPLLGKSSCSLSISKLKVYCMKAFFRYKNIKQCVIQ